jgi:hypothetical protein
LISTKGGRDGGQKLIFRIGLEYVSGSEVQGCPYHVGSLCSDTNNILDLDAIWCIRSAASIPFSIVSPISNIFSVLLIAPRPICNLADDLEVRFSQLRGGDETSPTFKIIDDHD